MDASNIDRYCNPDAAALNKALEKHVAAKAARSRSRMVLFAVMAAAVASIPARPLPFSEDHIYDPFGGRGCGDPDCDICV
jgi:hypothetical protein